MPLFTLRFCHRPSLRSARPVQFLAATAIVLFALSLGSCSSSKNKGEDAKHGSEQEVYQRAQNFLKNKNWQMATKTLQSMEEYYPFGTYAEQAQLELIYAYYRDEQYEQSAAAADRFIRLHPQHRDVDYAYYMRGVANFYNKSVFAAFFPTDVTKRDVGSAKEAFGYFEQLIRQYPNSPYVLDAQRRMIYLRNTLARSEINVANYYFKRGAYLAAINRGRDVVENMQGAPAVPDGLAVMAEGYHLLGMQDLADDSAKVLKFNYPDYPGLRHGEFDYTYGHERTRTWVSYVTFGLFDQAPTIKFDTSAYYQEKAYSQEAPVAPPSNN